MNRQSLSRPSVVQTRLISTPKPTLTRTPTADGSVQAGWKKDLIPSRRKPPVARSPLARRMLQDLQLAGCGERGV
jgi:hypothetical protein